MQCATCQAEILEKQMFGARFADGKWSVFCENHALAEGLALKPMNAARMWVVDGAAEAHRAEQKAIEDADSVS